ncbi:MAG TPA: PAS domain S-box protein [Armatimonadota bacterium]|nr:PAS domain S-box protein [Armatimonadota bacterium]
MQSGSGEQDCLSLEQELAYAREELRAMNTLMDSSPVITILWQWGAVARVEFVSTNIARFGYSPDDLISGRISTSTLIPRDDLARLRAQIADSLANDITTFHREYRMLTATGETRWVEDHTSLSPFSTKDSPCFQSYLLDVTARKTAEDALRTSQERLWSLFENAPIPILISSGPEQNTVALNKIFTDVFGYTFDDIPLADDWWQQAYPDSAYRHEVIHAWEQRLEHAIQTKSAIAPMETTVTCKNGTKRQVEFHASSIGEWNIVIGIDLTNLRKTEMALRDSETKFRTLTDTAAVAIVIVRQGKVLYENPYFTQLMGYHHDELLQIPLNELVDPAHRQAIRDEVTRLVNGEEALAHCEVMAVNKSGQRIWLGINATSIKYQGQPAVLVIAYDTTALHELQQRQEDLLHIVSHDLRNPLSIINAHVHLIDNTIQTAGITDHLQESISAIERGVQRMNALIQDLVDAARMDGQRFMLQRQPVSLAAFFADLLIRAKSSMDVGRVITEIPTDLPMVHADIDRLERIVMNLLSNALKYSPPGTPVLIRAEEQEHDILITIRNEGQGIAPEDMPHLFERFFRGQSWQTVEGTGLGLFISKLLVEAHGGHIWAESTPGKGSTFFLTLPRSPEAI